MTKNKMAIEETDPEFAEYVKYFTENFDELCKKWFGRKISAE